MSGLSMRRFYLFVLGWVGFVATIWFKSGGSEGSGLSRRFLLYSGLTFLLVWTAMDFVRRRMTMRIEKAARVDETSSSQSKE